MSVGSIISCDGSISTWVRNNFLSLCLNLSVASGLLYNALLHYTIIGILNLLRNTVLRSSAELHDHRSAYIFVRCRLAHNSEPCRFAYKHSHLKTYIHINIQYIHTQSSAHLTLAACITNYVYAFSTGLMAL